MKSILLGVLGLLVSTGVASAVLDDLESIGPDSTPILTRTINSVTITITASNGLQLLARTYYAEPAAFDGAGGVDNAPLNPGNVSLARFISTDGPGPGGDFNDAAPITFEFDPPISEFGLTTLDLLENGSLPSSSMRLDAFDANHNLVDQHVRSGLHGPSGLDLDWLVTGDGISRAVLTGSIDLGAGYGIDDLVLHCESTATSNAGCHLICPLGDVPTLADQGLDVLVSMLDGDCVPVPGYPADDIQLDGLITGNVVWGGGGMPADFNTDASGQTTFTGATHGGGYSPKARVLVAGVPLNPPLEIVLLSPDMTGDLAVTLADVGRFVSCWSAEGDECDFSCDGIWDLADVGIFAAHIGHRYPN